MRLFVNAVVTSLILSCTDVEGFTSPNGLLNQKSKNKLRNKRSNLFLNAGNDDDALYQSILKEGRSTVFSKNVNVDVNIHGKEGFRSRRSNRIVLPESSLAPDVMLTSSIVAPPSMPTYQDDEMAGADADAGVGGDDFLSDYSSFGDEQEEIDTSSFLKPLPKTKRKIFGIKFTDSGETLQSRLEKKDYNGIITSYLVPITALSVGAVWSSRQIIMKYNEKMNSVLLSYANEMVYHDGDFEEMQMCHNDYKKRLVTLGPKKKDRMLNSYLEIYAKKKPVSPQAISSLSHAFSIYKLSEENAAKALVDVAKECMKDKIASAGKLLFFGERILNSPGGQLALQPIRDMLANSYRAGGKQIVATSQKTMGEAAYRATIAASGKDQNALTPGWEILGLTKETAERIFAEVAETGFKSKREMEYSGVRQKYDAKGRKIDDDGKLLDPSEAEDDEDGSDDGGGSGVSGSVYECTECGYTLFPAAGREFKFFPDTFKCPECGASKDKFEDRSKK